MILGIGTDIVDISRFQSWSQAPESRLLKIFAPSELAQCRASNGEYQPEKLAARFAAKEAFFKALSASLCTLSYTSHTFSLMFACQHITVAMTEWQVPIFVVDWAAFEQKIHKTLPRLQTDLSLAHEKHAAIAFVVISQID